VLSYDTCRPFSKNRSGLVLGEGAAMLVLEDWDHATWRGARIYAELCGFGSNADAGDLTSPDGANIARAMEMAMLDAKLAKNDVGYVNAHGTGTLINDLVEAKAVSAVFCDATPPLISSNKGVMGHCLGAAGAIEAMATALSLYHQCIPPTANCIEPDPSINLDVVADGCRQGNFAAAISNSFAFGGLNAVLALRRHHSMTG
jgi:nodulation protein E